MLLYSTCTFAPEENEMQVASFISEHPDFHLIPVKKEVENATADGLTEFGDEMKLCRRFYPHVSRGEGQFIALLQRDGKVENLGDEKAEKKKSKKEKISKPDPNIAVVKDFLGEVLTCEGICETEKYDIILGGDGNYYLAPKIAMPKAVKCPGVAVGAVQKGRLVPHHNFFSAYGHLFKRKIILRSDDERTNKYLHGESIMTDCENGFAAVLYGTAPMGGAKVTSGEAKNYYPKGLRTK
jgi:NOL1/NOP2/fmu family ribosome biogenesis protein